MIKFFRKIRYDLMEKNLPARKGTAEQAGKTGKYLKYAIGEIILVVLGILIALQINNWNEKQKDLKLTNVYYCRILDDFKLDKALIKKTQNDVNDRITIGKQLIIDLHNSDKDKNALLNDWLKVIRLEPYVPRKIAFDDLTSSGNLKLITNLQLKNSLAEYYGSLENILKQINQNRDEMVRRSFPKNPTDFGVQEFDYLKTTLGSDVLKLLPENNWIHDKESDYFIDFQNLVVFTITMLDRHKQHLDRVSKEMELPYSLLTKQCEIK